MIKPRPVDHSNTLRGEGSKAGMDRRPPKLLTDAVNIFLSSGWLVLRLAYSELKNFVNGKYGVILLAIIIIIVSYLVVGEVNTVTADQNFTGV
jgi:putative copper export protein